MQITHVKSNIVPDFTGTVTVYDNSGSTQTVAATNLVRPSDWNSAHALAITLTGNTAGESTVSGTNIIWQGGPNITLSGSAGTVLISGGAGGGGGVAVSAGAASVSNGTVVFSNSHNVSFGLNGSTVTASASYSQSTAPGAIAAGTQTATSGTMVFSNSNGITFGMSGSTRITASHNGLTSQSNQAFSAAGGSSAFQTLSFLNANGLSFSNNGGGVQGSYTVPTVPAQLSVGLSNLGNTAGDTGVFTGRVVFVGSDNITLSGSSNGGSATVSLFGPTPGGGGNFSAGVSGGNTSGDTGATGTRVVFAGGNNITLSQATNANGATITVSGANTVAQSVQTQSLIAALYDGANSISTGTVRLSNLNGISFGINGQTLTGSHNGLTSQSNQNVTAANGGFAFQTLSFSNANGISFGTSAGSAITASHNGLTSQSNQQISGYAVSNTTQSSSGTLNAANLSFAGAGIASVGVSNGSVVISVPAGGGAGDGVVSLGMSTEGNTAGTTGMVSSGRMIFVGSGPISLSQSLNGQSGTLSILGPATSSLSATGFLSISTNGSTISIGAGPLSFYATGNTTQSSSGTIDGRSITIQGTGGASVGISNGSIVISGATGGAGGGGTATMWQPFNEGVNVAGQHGQATLHIAPLPTPPTAAGGEVQIDRLCVPLYFSNSSNSTGSATLSLWYGLYTRDGTSLSRMHSTSYSTAITFSGTVSSATYNGIRLHTIPWTTTIPDGRYYVGMISRTTTAGGNGTLSQVLVSQLNSNFSGIFGAASNATNQWPLGWGVFNSSTTALPDTVGFSRINGTASLAARPPSWFMISSTA